MSVRVLWQEEVHLDGTWKRIGQRDDFIEARAGRGTARTPGATGTSCGGQSPPPLRPLGSWSHEGGTPRGWGLRSWRGAAVTGAWRDGSSSPSPASARPNWNSENNGAQVGGPQHQLLGTQTKRRKEGSVVGWVVVGGGWPRERSLPIHVGGFGIPGEEKCEAADSLRIGPPRRGGESG